ncbi:hypothetical protein ACIP5Y_04385 [Nocardia sp. NPDC088792]|uniref:hypothetical protein n=1 Tax=Nocardia sp. NPDC088792 TaxID=3364332 RepID=UPI00380B3D62
MRPHRILAAFGVTLAVAATALWSVPLAQAEPGQLAQVAELTGTQYRDSFVQRDGSRLSVAGRDSRFSGANVEWLGLMNYGPDPSAAIPAGSARYATKYEVDDALATARDMGATVLRAQTLGDTVGCPQCLEPALGQFNPAAFAQIDLVVAEARNYGIKLIGEFDGDGNGAPAPGQLGQSHGWYCVWRQRADCGHAFFTDPDLIGDYEQHMRAVLDHVNPLTGLAYKDDPTFAGWVDGNDLDIVDGVPGADVVNWLRTVSGYFRTLDDRQLFMDISSVGTDPAALRIPGVDVYGTEYYPHWAPVIDGNRIDGAAPGLHQQAAQTVAAGKVFSPLEFGWDSTDFLTPAALDQFLTGLETDPNIAGDNFWALQSHADGHGWQPIPADTRCTPTCAWGEDGNWWALYYTGVDTLSMSAPDMAARAQLLRAHAYRMAGFPDPPVHQPVPAPVITSAADGAVLFQGAAGAPDYTIQKQTPDGWNTVCDHCTTDAAPAWRDTTDPGCYRVIGYNLDGLEGPASDPAGNCDRRPRP